MPELRIRPYTEADAAELLRIERACVDAEVGMVLDAEQLPADPRGFDEALRSDPELGTALVAEQASRLLGHASVRLLRPARIRHVAVFAVEVDPAAQGRGVGRALMEAAMAWASERGARRFELYVRSDNPRAIGLYRSLGFELEGVRKQFVRTRAGCFVDDWIMARLMASPAHARPAEGSPAAASGCDKRRVPSGAVLAPSLNPQPSQLGDLHDER